MPPSNNQPQPPLWQQPAQPPLYPPPVAPAPPDGSMEPQLPEPQGPAPGYPEAAPQPSRRKLWVVASAVLAALIVGAATYFVVTNRQEAGPADGVSSNEPVPMESLAGATLIPPANLGRFQANPDNTNTNMQYATLDGSCTLRMGIASEADLPGKDFDEIVKNHVQKLKDGGAAVQGPTGGTPIKMKNAADDGKVYTMPTAVFTASREGTYTASHYSAAILKDGTRSFTERVCETKDALASPAQLDELDKDAESSMVIAQ